MQIKKHEIYSYAEKPINLNFIFIKIKKCLPKFGKAVRMILYIFFVHNNIEIKWYIGVKIKSHKKIKSLTFRFGLRFFNVNFWA